MNFKIKLSERIQMDDIYEILRLVHDSESRKQELYDLIYGEDEKLGYHAAWIFTHSSEQDNKWLFARQNELIDEVLVCKHAGKRRVILNLLYRQPLTEITRVDFLDFCLENISSKELPAIQSLCLKIAYELCLSIPELMQELKTILEMMEAELSPAVGSVRKNVLKAMQKGKSLQKGTFR